MVDLGGIDPTKFALDPSSNLSVDQTGSGDFNQLIENAGETLSGDSLFFLQLQQQIAKEKNAIYLGKKLKVLIDKAIPNQNDYTHIARTQGQALEIDSQVYLKGKNLKVGSIIQAKIKKTKEYDLYAQAL